jgi:hypothetical protein
MLRARLFESLPLVCSNWGADMRLIALPSSPMPRPSSPFSCPSVSRHAHPIAPARGPRAWDDAPEPVPDWDLVAQPDPGFAFDQRLSW